MAIKKEKTAKNTAELSKYIQVISRGEREHEKWWEQGKKIVKRYRDDDRTGNDSALPARYNSLWSNIQVTTPLYYARTPNVQVDRRFKDADPVGRVASQLMERAGQETIDAYEFDDVMKAVVSDLQLPGRGTAWVRYVPSVSETITYQQVLCDHVQYTDFCHSPAKRWKDVSKVWRYIYLTRRQLKERFGSDLGSKIPLDYSAREDENGKQRETEDAPILKQARIIELWDADTMKVAWISKSYKEQLLDYIDDPLGLRNFYPTPRPLFATMTTDSLIPVPDYKLYQDQARELDRITVKISLLQDALRMVGLYDSRYQAELKNLYENTKQNQMIPIPNWAAFQAAGGLAGVSQWMSIKEIIEALEILYKCRAEAKQDLYEITGMSDILRGSTSPTETATAQQIKGQFATARIQDRQREVQRYAKDLIALQCEIIAEHFEPEMIALMTGTDVTRPEVQQQFYPAVELLKNDTIRGFRIDIETDSMVAIDETLDKEKTNEFLTTMGKMLESSLAVMQQAPVLAPLMGEIMLYAVRRFNAGRSLESAIEQGMSGLMQMAQAAMTQPPAPDPAVMKVQAQAQLENQKAQNDFLLKQKELEQKTAMHAQEMQGRMALEQQKTQQSVAVDRFKAENEMEIARVKAANELEIKLAELAHKDKIETKHAVLKAGIEKIHLAADGSLTSHPTIIKRGVFGFDADGNRTVTVVEKPMTGDDGEDSDELSEENPPRVKTGRARFNPLTGEHELEMIDTPIQAAMTNAQGGM